MTSLYFHNLVSTDEDAFLSSGQIRSRDFTLVFSLPLDIRSDQVIVLIAVAELKRQETAWRENKLGFQCGLIWFNIFNKIACFGWGERETEYL